MAIKSRYLVGCALWMLSMQTGQAADCTGTYDCTIASGSYTGP